MSQLIGKIKSEIDQFLETWSVGSLEAEGGGWKGDAEASLLKSAL